MNLSSRTSRNLAKERAYYNTLNHGVDSAELTPLDPTILVGAQNRIEEKLKSTDELRQILGTGKALFIGRTPGSKSQN